MAKSYKIPKAEPVDFEKLQREARAKAELKQNEAQGENVGTKQMEVAELEQMLNHGIEYTITYTAQRGILRRRNKKTYTIYEPTLAVLDEISRVSMDLVIDEKGIAKGGYDTIRASKRAVVDNAKKMARIAAIATLGEDIFDKIGGRCRYNRRRVERLTELLYHTTKPSQLAQLATAVTRDRKSVV